MTLWGNNGARTRIVYDPDLPRANNKETIGIAPLTLVSEWTRWYPGCVAADRLEREKIMAKPNWEEELFQYELHKRNFIRFAKWNHELFHVRKEVKYYNWLATTQYHPFFWSHTPLSLREDARYDHEGRDETKWWIWPKWNWFAPMRTAESS